MFHVIHIAICLYDDRCFKVTYVYFKRFYQPKEVLPLSKWMSFVWSLINVFCCKTPVPVLKITLQGVGATGWQKMSMLRFWWHLQPKCCKFSFVLLPNDNKNIWVSKSPPFKIHHLNVNQYLACLHSAALFFVQNLSI